MTFSITPPNGAVANFLRSAENARPTEADYAAIGKIALQHTGLQYQFETLVWDYMGDVDIGHISTCRMGVQEITDTLLALVEWTEPEDAIEESVRWSVDFFHKLRLKRNSIIHGYNFIADNNSGNLYVEKRTKSIVFADFEEFEFTPDTLREICDEQTNLSTYLHSVSRLIRRRGQQYIGHESSPPSEPTPLPPKPATPKILTPLPHSNPKSARHQRRASQETATRDAKKASKDRQRQSAKRNQTHL